MAKRTVSQRFWAKVNSRLLEFDTDQCWEWGKEHSHTEDGYGQFFAPGIIAGPRLLKAHRVVWKLETGQDPGEMFVLHRCDNPSCVRISHLYLGTRQDNVDDMIKKGRGREQKKTHCKNGHPLEGDNVYNPSTRPHIRVCRTCAYASNRASQKKHRQDPSKREMLTARAKRAHAKLQARRDAGEAPPRKISPTRQGEVGRAYYLEYNSRPEVIARKQQRQDEKAASVAKTPVK